MTKMKNMTKENLEIIWEQLDDACGSLDNAMMNIASIKNMPEFIKNNELGTHLSFIVALKNQVEEELERKGGCIIGN